MSENRNADGAALGAETPRGCVRAEEFVTYLYGEATPDESRLFRRHLEACAVCREELTALGVVRETVGVWRSEALGSVPSLGFGDAAAPAAEARPELSRRRSASAALREFFSLAPVWLRAGAFAATLALCALTALTLSRAEVSWDANGLAFRAGAPVVKEQAAPPAHDLYTAEQLEAAVARRVAEATSQLTEQQRQQQRQQQQPDGIVNVAAVGDKSRAQSAAAAANVQRRKRVQRPGSRRAEPLLAEDNLPRLSDLLDGSY